MVTAANVVGTSATQIGAQVSTQSGGQTSALPIAQAGAAAGASANATTTKATGSKADTAARSNNAGKDDSEFAQLLDGMESDAAASTTKPSVAPTKKAATTANADATATGLSDEMLALIAVPAAPVTPPATTPVITATSAGQSASNGTAAVDVVSGASVASGNGNAAANLLKAADIKTSDVTNAAVNKDATGKNTQAANASNKDDLQWLRAATQASDAQVAAPANGVQTSATQASIVQSGAQAAIQQPVTTAKDGKSAKSSAQNNVVLSAPTSASDASSTQTNSVTTPKDLYQQLVAQTTPMVSVATDHGDDRDTRSDEGDSATTAINGQTLTSTAQTTATQLANDVQAADASTHHQLRSAVGGHQWVTELGDKLTMMATTDMKSATLHMSPADLGPVQVRIDLNQNQASVWFTADHADTRSALEQSLPRLREMFAAQGMSLSDAGVFNGQPRQQTSYSSSEQSNSSALRFAGDEASETISSARGISLSLLDAYA